MVQNIELDSIGVRVLHYMDGRELFDAKIAVSDTIHLQNISEDMYIVGLYWPRTYIPHQIFRNKAFSKDLGEDYVLTKAFYVVPNESQVYIFRMDTLTSALDIELNNIKAFTVDTKNCPSCKVADLYWDNYNNFFERKDSLVEKLNHSYYDAVDSSNKLSRERFLEVDSVKNKLWIDEAYLSNLEGIVKDYPDSKASSFFVFYQLYMDQDFPKYLHLFQHLRGDAKESKYYKMTAKRYE